jgi:HAD superfamily hydrolase (TIGR01490 family)
MTPDSHLRPAAFFDLDRTLISVNSAFQYASYERRRGKISFAQYLRAAFWMGMYHLSLIDMERAFAEAVRQYEGALRDDLERITEEFFHGELVSTFQPGAADALRFHRSEGHPLVLLTASSSFLSKLAAQTWDLDHFLSNHFPTDERGRLRGTFERPMCYGQGKVVHARRWAQQMEVDLHRSYFYSDSFSDVPMLRAVGHPRVVNPDPRLRRLAEREGWPIEDWRQR